MIIDNVEDMRAKRSLWSLLIERFIPIIAWLLVVASLGLQFAAQNRMGVYRSLSYRNQVLNEGIFAPGRLDIYSWLIIAGLLLCLLIFGLSERAFSKRNRPIGKPTLEYRWLSYLIRTAFLSGGLVIMFRLYNNVLWLAYPWIVLAVSIVLCVHYFRLFYVGTRIVSLRQGEIDLQY